MMHSQKNIKLYYFIYIFHSTKTRYAHKLKLFPLDRSFRR